MDFPLLEHHFLITMNETYAIHTYLHTYVCICMYVHVLDNTQHPLNCRKYGTISFTIRFTNCVCVLAQNLLIKHQSERVCMCVCVYRLCVCVTCVACVTCVRV